MGAPSSPSDRTIKRILHVEHGWGGGIHRHLTDLARFLRQDGIESLRCKPSGGFWLDLDWIHETKAETSLRLIPGDVPQCVRTLRALNVFHVHFHTIVAYNAFSIERLLAAIKQAGLQYDFTIHDYAVLCPRLHMTDRGDVYCRVASFRYCDRCVATAGTPFGDVDPASWRARYLLLLQDARRVLVPNPDVAERLASYLRVPLRLLLRPHPEPSRAPIGPAPRARRARGCRRVAIIGNLTVIKGLNVVRAMVLDALARKLALQFVIFGKPSGDDLASLPNVEVKGAFVEADSDTMIRDDDPDLAFFPSVCPETHLYTLSIAFRNAIFPISFDIGAQAERIKRSGYGAVLPLSLSLSPAKLNDQLIEMEIPIPIGDSMARQGIAAWTGARTYYDMPEL
jgi:glycosyltransferase involved in cell wall biosynthesis